MSETEIKVPNIGDFKDVEVIEVLVTEGQSIKKNDALITIESDKSSVEIPSNLEGKIKNLKIKVGDKVSEGDLILTVESDSNVKKEVVKEKPEIEKKSKNIEAIKPEIQEKLFLGDLGKPFDYEDNSFDLVISVGCLHNLSLPYINTALSEIQRVSYQSYVMVESFRDEKEFFNLECWALTAETLLDVDSWQWLMGRAGYTGDFEFIFFE